MKKIVTMHDIIGLLNLLMISKIDFIKIYVPRKIYDSNIELFQKYSQTFLPYGGTDAIGIVLRVNDNCDSEMDKTINLLSFFGWHAKKQVESMGVVICW